VARVGVDDVHEKCREETDSTGQDGRLARGQGRVQDLVRHRENEAIVANRNQDRSCDNSTDRQGNRRAFPGKRRRGQLPELLPLQRARSCPRPRKARLVSALRVNTDATKQKRKHQRQQDADRPKARRARREAEEVFEGAGFAQALADVLGDRSHRAEIGRPSAKSVAQKIPKDRSAEAASETRTGGAKGHERSGGLSLRA